MQNDCALKWTATASLVLGNTYNADTPQLLKRNVSESGLEPGSVLLASQELDHQAQPASRAVVE